MLQQTQVSRVIPKYENFVDRWPTVEDLSTADTDELLRSWSGLGYNSRVLRLQGAAVIIASEGWPDSISGLRELPGVGPYTAAAVGSIAFGADVPAVDTNLKRILSRWAGEPLSGSALHEFALDVIGTPAGDWNQALMDLGSALCRTIDPTCRECPVSEWCLDPTVYEAPRRQSAFNGSNRQLRGALVRAHLAGEDLLDSGIALDRSEEDTRSTIDALRLEGLIS
jgi:A/G-specific adenine glycosylase